MLSTLKDNAVSLMLLTLVYVFFAAGYVDTIDADPSIETAKALIERQSFITHPQFIDFMVYKELRPKGSGYVTKMGILTPILYIAPVLTGKILSTLLGIDRERSVQFFVSLFNSLITALCVLFLHELLKKQGFGYRRALGLALLFGFATLALPYAKTCHREPLQALALISGLFYLVERRYFLSGVLLSLGFLTKNAFLVVMAPFALFVFVTTTNRERVRFFAPLLTAVLLQFLFQYLIFNNPLENGYQRLLINPQVKAWKTPFLEGVWQQTFSLEHGLFIFSPVLTLFFPLLYLRIKEKTLTKLHIATLAAIFIQLCVYSSWWVPLGGWSLSARYLVVVLPLFFLFVLPTDFELLQNPILKMIVFAIVLISCAFQVVNSSVKPQQYWVLKEKLPSSLHFSHLKANLDFFAHKIQGRPELYNAAQFGGGSREINLTQIRSLQGLNFWWAHLGRLNRSNATSIGIEEDLCEFND